MLRTRVTLPDVHFPFEDKPLLREWLKFVKRVKPDGVDIIGDMLDCYSLSRFDKNPARKETLQDEIDSVRDFLYTLREIVPDADIRYSEGNHEDRLRRLLWSKAPGLASLRDLNMDKLLGLRELGVKWYSAGDPYKIGSLWFSHGAIIRKHAGSSARATGDKVGSSILIGHSHRMGYCPYTSWTGLRGAWECGHICDPNQAEYTSGVANWQSGWTVTHHSQNGLFDVEFVRVIPNSVNRKLVYRGEVLATLAL